MAEKRTLADMERENVAKLSEMLQSLYGIWDKVGVDDDDQVNRGDQVFGHVFDLLRDIHAEEIGFYEDIEERIRNYEKKISELITELELPAPEEIGATALIVREENLRQQLDELSKLKHKRMKRFQALHAQESRYCKVLGMPPIELSSSTGVPNEKDMYELEQHIQMLKEEREYRQKKFLMLKKELTTILEITELTPETPQEKQIFSSNEDSFSLSNETFKVLQDFVEKTNRKKADLENEKAVLMDKLFVLWDVLKVEKEDRERFLSEHADCRVSSINAAKEEIARCERIKRQNIAQYIEALKEELFILWKKCFISESPKKSFVFQNEEEEANETVLERYDNEVAKLRKYYKDTEHIIKKIEKRQELWDLMIVFENKANDPNRFKNRGGNLLQEERDRKKLQKDLPALENEIFLAIEKFEEETEKRFLYYGNDFRKFVSKQWEDRLSQKENEKIQRQKLRSKQTEDSRIMGKTPLKRTMISTTPKSAPSKLFKASVGVSIYRTPNLTALKPVPSTTAKMRTTKQAVKKVCNSVKKTENILKEKNENVGNDSGLDSTTYTDFAEKLESSSRKAHRSSVLCSRKIAGTRISTSKSKRKSVNKSLQKSIKIKDSSKITPARGKLGLPFLI